MPGTFWIGFGIAAFCFLAGVFMGARSRSVGVAAGAAIGAYLGVMFGFPLLAIGLSTA